MDSNPQEHLISIERQDPVVVELVVEGFGSLEATTYEIERTRWNSLTPAERTAEIVDAAEAFAGNYVAWGWDIADPSDFGGIA